MGVLIYLSLTAFIGLCLYISALRTYEHREYMRKLEKMERNHNRSLKR